MSCCMVSAKLQLPASCAIRVMVYVPGVLYAWAGEISVEVVPSPKSQRYVVLLLISCELLVKLMVVGAQSVVKASNSEITTGRLKSILISAKLQL